MRLKFEYILYLVILSAFIIIFINMRNINLKMYKLEKSVEETIEKVVQLEEHIDKIKSDIVEIDILMQNTNKTIEEKNNKLEKSEEEITKLEEQIKICEENTDSLIGSLEFGYDNALILHKISVAEAGGESVESMALAMLVILNRINNDDFPDTIRDVVFEKGQFTPISDGRYDESQPNEKSYEAMKLILNGWDESKGALYFRTSKNNTWHSRNLTYLFEKDGTTYYK